MGYNARMEKIDIDVKLTHEDPVDLVEMATALISMSRLASDRIGKQHGLADVKILLKGVDKGSDIYRLVFDFGAAVLPMVEGFNAVASFVEYLDRFRRLSSEPIEEISNDESINVRDATMVENIINPVIHNNNASMTIYGGNNNINLNITMQDAIKMKENAELVKRLHGECGENDKVRYEKVLIEMYETKNTDRKVRDKAYCEEILPGRAIPTIFENNEDKRVVLDDPYNNYFLVDIEVNRIDGEPKLYRVQKLHSIVPKE